MALRQQQQQLQLQALATGGSVVSTLPIGASPVIQQQQVVSVAGVQGGRGGAGGQMQQSVVLPVRTTPLAGATGTATHTVRHSVGLKGGQGDSCFYNYLAEVRFQQTHHRCFRQLFLVVSWDPAPSTAHLTVSLFLWTRSH